MNKDKLKEHLIENTGYLKWGPERIKDQFSPQLSTQEVINILDEIRRQKKDNKEETNKQTKEKTAYLRYLEQMDIKEENVSKVKHYQTHDGETRYSITEIKDNIPTEESIKDILQDHFSNYKSTIPQPSLSNKNTFGAHINLYDAHLDNLSLSGVLEGKDTLENNIDNFKDVFSQLVDKIDNNKVDTVFFPVGHDLWETNDQMGGTKSNSNKPPEAHTLNSHWTTSYKQGLNLIRQCIDYLATHFNKVHVPIIYGNHSEDKEFFLGETLDHVYRETPHVNINNEKIYRKYYTFGNNLFVFSHGDNESSISKIKKLPMTIMGERPQLYANAEYRHIILGHFHHKNKYKFITQQDLNGCEIHFLRSVSSESVYEHKNGFSGTPKSAEASIFSFDGQSRTTEEIIWK